MELTGDFKLSTNKSKSMIRFFFFWIPARKCCVVLATSYSNVYEKNKIDRECSSCYNQVTLFLTGLRSAVSRVVIFVVRCSW